MTSRPGVSLVVGGTGFIGRHLVRALRAQGEPVRVMAREHSHSAPHDPTIEFVVGDMGNRGQLALAMEGVSTVYHLASSTVPASSAADPAFDVETNVVSAIPLLHFCAARRARLVFTSSGGTVYGMPETLPIPETHPTWPISTHGVGKLAVEKLLFAFGCTGDLDYRILRLSNVYGEGQNSRKGMGAVVTFLENTIAGRAIVVWGDGSQRRDFLHVDDAVDALVKVGHINSPRWRIMNVGSGRDTTIAALCNLVFQVTGQRTAVEHVPARRFDVPANVLDIRRAREVLGFTPQTGLEEGIQRTWTWLRTAELPPPPSHPSHHT